VSWAVASTRAGLATLLYTAATIVMFSVSATYHRVHWKSATAQKWMKRADHSMIFVFIAGTYTPIAALTLSRTAALAVLAVVWTGALFGVVLQTAWPQAPHWVALPCYIALGWVAIFVFPDLLRSAGVTTFALIAVGGVVYTLGALVYAWKRPNPWPGTFGFHEVFHACTLLVALCHYVAIWLTVLR
jgi:hemolysin III